MSLEENAVIAAWKATAKDLSIQVTAPHITQDDSAHEIVFTAFLPNFGNEQGAPLIAADAPYFETDERAKGYAEKHGHFLSILNSEVYSEYNSTSFIDALNDIGYFGNSDTRPSWYTGQPWTT